MKKVAQKKKKKVVHRKKSLFKPRGVSKVVLLGVVALVLAAGGGIFVMSQQKAGSISMPSLIKPALNDKCKYNDPELCKFINNMQTHTEYSVTTTSEIGKMKTETLTEMSGEDKFHMVSKQDGKEHSNMISMGDTTYTLDYSDNKWWKQTLKPSVSATPEIEQKDQNAFKPDENDDKTTYKFIAKEACGDKMCFKYQMLNPDTTDAQMYIWFDDQEYLMRKMRVEANGQGASESIYSYGSVSIFAPSPVKDGDPYAVKQPSDADIQKMMKDYQQQAPANEAPADTTNTNNADEPSSDQ